MEEHRFIIHSLEVLTGIETSLKQEAANKRLTRQFNECTHNKHEISN